MTRTLVLSLALVAVGSVLPAQRETTPRLELRVGDVEPRRVELVVDGEVLVTSPPEGLWSVGTAFADGWPSRWDHARPARVETGGEWTVLYGALDLDGGRFELRDAYRLEGDHVRGVRRFTWRGEEPLARCVLSVRWSIPGAREPRPLLPGISYYGNPSGARHPERVPVHVASSGVPSLYEEHRYPMPFACLEWTREGTYRGAALHTLPSQPAGARYTDQWWSLGFATTADGAELLCLSGPVATNGRRNVVKAQQRVLMDYPAPWVTLRPGAVVEKTFHLQAFALDAPGTAVAVPVETSIDLHRPFGLDGLPSYATILDQKRRYAESRYRDRAENPGFEMYPDDVAGTRYVMGWCGQAAAAGYAYLALAERFGVPGMRIQAARSLDVLTTSPVDAEGFFVRYDAEADAWSGKDPVSQGQAMESFSLALETARAHGDVDAGKWERFLRAASDAHAARILREDWHPRSTNEGFLVSPLLRAARLFGEETWRRAAMKAVEHYASRHLTMEEPYWGGTLDASCEDKEGAWAAMQAFLAAYEDSGDPRHLAWAEHAMNVFLTYVVVWDIEMPPGRLRDHGFRSHGWTAVSPQNEHLDVYGVVATPDLYRLGVHLGRPDLQKLAAVMYRSCGQLVDPFGSQGEQIQQTNYAQHGDMSDVFRLRGAYSEGWTVFWITAHFLHAAARFEAMGVDLDREGDFTAAVDRPAPAPLFRDPVFDGAADPVLVWNRGRAAWWMLYTQRRAKLDLPQVEWCHGTEVGVAESRDFGRTWRYVGTLSLEALDEDYSFWAPDIVEVDSMHHLFVSYVPGRHVDWGGERHILHYKSHDLMRWDFVGRVLLTSDFCIDPTLYRFPDGAWRMWYKDEGHGSATHAVESDDLVAWRPVGDPGVSELYGEAPKVFRFGGWYWMLKDPNSGLDVYRSSDLATWENQGKILDRPGTRNDDGNIGKHADVVVVEDRAFVFYFTHPDGQDHPLRDGVMPFAARRSSIQVAELFVRNGKLVCDRDGRCEVELIAPH